MLGGNTTTDETADQWVHGLMHGGLAEITEKSHLFVKERNWEIHDTIANLTLALSSEVGELADIFAWVNDDVQSSEIIRGQNEIAQELADILIVLVRLAKVYSINTAEDLVLRSGS